MNTSNTKAKERVQQQQKCGPILSMTMNATCLNNILKSLTEEWIKQVIHYDKTVFIRGMKGQFSSRKFINLLITFKIKGKKTNYYQYVVIRHQIKVKWSMPRETSSKIRIEGNYFYNKNKSTNKRYLKWQKISYLKSEIRKASL